MDVENSQNERKSMELGTIVKVVKKFVLETASHFVDANIAISSMVIMHSYRKLAVCIQYISNCV